MTVIDIHAHYLAPYVLETFRGADGARIGVTIVTGGDGREVLHVGDEATNQPIPLGLTAEDERFAAMDDAGVDVQVVSSWMQLHGYNLPLEQGIALARLQNDTLADFVERNGRRLLGAATVPLQAPDAAADELERTAAAYRFRAVQIGTHVNDQELDDPALDPFWEAAARLGFLVLIHPFDPPGRPRLRRHLLELVIGYPSETAIAGAALLLGGVCERHPSLNVCLAHGGGFVPFQVGRMQRGFEVLGERAACDIPPAQSLRSLYYDSIMHDSRALRFLIEQVGADRVLLGSDYPFNMGESHPRASVDGVSGLSVADRANVEEGNAAALLQLDAGVLETAGE